jgi:hypothetical protein
VQSEEPATAGGVAGLDGLGFPSRQEAQAPPGTGGGNPDDPGRRQPRRRNLRSRLSGSDLAFRGILRGGGVFVLLLELLVGVFLFYRADGALRKAGWSFFTTQHWSPNGGGFGIAAVMVGTILIALVAVIIAIPLSMGAALYISEYAPAPLKRVLASVVDLMAAVPAWSSACGARSCCSGGWSRSRSGSAPGSGGSRSSRSPASIRTTRRSRPRPTRPRRSWPARWCR